MAELQQDIAQRVKEQEDRLVPEADEHALPGYVDTVVGVAPFKHVWRQPPHQQILEGPGNPNTAKINAPKGTLYIEKGAPRLWQNADGRSTWIERSGAELWKVTTGSVVDPTVAVDSSGNGNDGVYDPFGGAAIPITFGVAGLVSGNEAAVAGGTADALVGIATEPAWFIADDFWINLWANFNEPSAGVQKLLFTFRTPTSGIGVAQFYLEGVTGGNARLGFAWDSENVDTDDAFANGTHMFSMKFDRSTVTATFYLDGQIFGTAQTGSAAPTAAASDGVIAGFAGPAGATYDEIAYGQGLPDDADFAALFAAASTSFGAYTTAQLGLGPEAYWHLDEVASGPTTLEPNVVTDRILLPADVVEIDSTELGFYGTTGIAKPTVTGSRGGNAALASLLTQLENLGLITDSSS